MGTRNLTMVVLNKEIRVAQYGQWDGYLEGQGKTVAEFIQKRLSDPDDLAKFRRKVDESVFVDDDTINERCRGKKCPANFSRDTAADILGMILDSPAGIELSNQQEFAGDSLFCEWAYLLDLDRETLEVYKGFNREPLPKGSRFENAPRGDDKPSDYYPIRLLGEIQFSRVTPDAVCALEPSDKEESA